jgi:hypothetical protein
MRLESAEGSRDVTNVKRLPRERILHLPYNIKEEQLKFDEVFAGQCDVDVPALQNG